jgi:hypothetical protein
MIPRQNKAPATSNDPEMGLSLSLENFIGFPVD